jgi:hypothetical protein
LASPPSIPPTVDPPEAAERICAPAPSTPTRIEATPFEATRADGSRSWGAEATYELSSGDIGEAFMVLDSDGSGEAQLMINGEIVAHVAVETPTSSPTPVVTSWMPESVNYSPEVIAEIMQVDLPRVLAENIPQEFKCSGWAKRALKAGKYLWAGAITAAAPVGCIVCAGVAGTVGAVIYDKLENHCD